MRELSIGLIYLGLYYGFIAVVAFVVYAIARVFKVDAAKVQTILDTFGLFVVITVLMMSIGAVLNGTARLLGVN